MAQTAAHLADHVIPTVPVRQWVISEPKRLRGMLADRPAAVSALTKIFIAEIQRLLLATSRGIPDAVMPRAARPRLGGISFLHRFGSALNHHVHLHACVTDGVFRPAADEARRDPRRRSCWPGRSPRLIWPPSPSGSAAARSDGSGLRACSTLRPPPPCWPGRTAGFQ